MSEHVKNIQTLPWLILAPLTLTLKLVDHNNLRDSEFIIFPIIKAYSA